MPTHLEIVDKKNSPGNEVIKYQNSFQLEPCNTFRVDPVDKIVKSVMMDNLDNAVYDETETPKLCMKIAADVRKRIQKLNFERHKIVVIVTIIERVSQSFETLAGYLWDAKRDNYSIFTHETQTLFASCCVFGTYYE